MKKIPYIGVTGFMFASQVEQILKNQNINPSTIGRRLMVGVLVSSKTLQGLENKWPMRYPKIKDLGTIFSSDPSCLNLIHFSSDHPGSLYDELMKITELAGPYLHGFQLNIPWPDKEQLLKYKEFYPGMQLVLHLGVEAFEEKEHDITKVYKAVVEYGELIDYILLDMSAGKGTPLDSNIIENLVSEFTPLGYLGVGVAGGLHAGNIQQKLFDIVVKYPDVSTDAEGKLQSENEGLNFYEVRRYLEASIALFQGVRV